MPLTIAWQSASFNDTEDAGSALVSMRLNVPSAFTVTVNYTTNDGSASARSDYISTSGALLSQQEFDRWGALRFTPIAQTSLNYTGQRLDATGLLYYHARYYNPVLARFISADSISPDQEDPQTRNRYSYVLNNPLKYTDPTGHCAAGDSDDPKACSAMQTTLAQYGVQLDDLSYWMLNELKLVKEGLDALIGTANWSIDDFKRAMGLGDGDFINLSRERGTTNKSYQAGWTILITDYSFSYGDDYARQAIVHEFAHQWDAASVGMLSSDMLRETGGSVVICADTWLGYGGCLGAYSIGDVENRPSKYARENKYEDFADSVTATVYPSLYSPKFPNSKRDMYVRRKYAEYDK